MEKLKFRKTINATPEKVYNTMLGINNIETYEQWTAEFNPTSTYIGNWEKGSKMLFVGVDPDGKRGGMVSEIAENTPFRFVSIRHYGILDGDREITEGEEVEKWAGGLENYSFEKNEGGTMVTVEMDAVEDFLDYFNKTYPLALNKLQELVENL
ncbi:MAG: SRPBCC domain-containing protein [Bacteroidia bacterium]|nr:SRPBCC domain-containing protein [Bacteroidia bacterium]